jgi:hypothetical protein
MVEAVISVIGAGLLGVIAWAFTLHSRVAVLEADKTSLRELVDAKLQNITERLARIEAKLDHQA